MSGNERRKMEERRVIIIFRIPDSGFQCDLEISLDMTADELVWVLNEAYQLGIQKDRPEQQYLRADHPIALIKGGTTLEELGLHQGSVVIAPHCYISGRNSGFLRRSDQDAAFPGTAF